MKHEMVRSKKMGDERRKAMKIGIAALEQVKAEAREESLSRCTKQEKS